MLYYSLPLRTHVLIFVFWNSLNLFFETVNTENKSQSDSEVTEGGKGSVGRPGGDSPVPGGGPESGGP